MKKISLIYLLFFLLPLFDCFLTEQEENEPVEVTLQNTLWILESFEIDGNIVKPPKDQVYTIQFKDDSTVSGKNDCNDINGSYTFKLSGVIKVTELGTTFANCGDNSMFRKYYKAIEQIFSYEINKNKLLLRYGENSILKFISK